MLAFTTVFFGLCTLAKPVQARCFKVLDTDMRLSQRAIGIDDRPQSESSTYKSNERGLPVSSLPQEHRFQKHLAQTKNQQRTSLRSDTLYPWLRHQRSPCRRTTLGSSSSNLKVRDVAIIAPARFTNFSTRFTSAAARVEHICIEALASKWIRASARRRSSSRHPRLVFRLLVSRRSRKKVHDRSASVRTPLGMFYLWGTLRCAL